MNISCNPNIISKELSIDGYKIIIKRERLNEMVPLLHPPTSTLNDRKVIYNAKWTHYLNFIHFPVTLNEGLDRSRFDQ